MSTESKSATGGIGLGGLLGLLFIGLKLTGTIDWSWWWVLAPFWLPLAAGSVIVGCFVILGLLLNYFTKRN